MAFSLDAHKTDDLISFVTSRIRDHGCDHTHRFAAEWSTSSGIAWNDLRDALEQNGAFCDCEVAANIDGPLALRDEPLVEESGNRWLLPPGYISSIHEIDRVVVARQGIGKHTYAGDGEWLIPAPTDAKPRKRMRKFVHFFIGLETGMPSQVGFVKLIPTITLSELTRRIRSSPVPEITPFDDRVAGFLCQKIASLPGDTPIGTEIVERVGIASKHKELAIHRVIVRK